MKTSCTLAVLALLLPATVRAEWTVKAFAGVSAASRSGLVDLERAIGTTKPLFGGGVGWEWSNGFGVELELATSPSFLKGSGDLVASGRLDTVMGNATWLLPRPSTRLRAYVSGGIGAARITFEDALDAFTSTSTLAAGNLGGGVLVPLRVARLVGDVRYIRSQVTGKRIAPGLAKNTWRTGVWSAVCCCVSRFAARRLQERRRADRDAAVIAFKSTWVY